MQKVFWKKEGTLEAPKSIQKNEHMKAHKKKLAMSQKEKLEIISKRGVYFHQKFHTLT